MDVSPDTSSALRQGTLGISVGDERSISREGTEQCIQWGVDMVWFCFEAVSQHGWSSELFHTVMFWLRL
jgi:hypothetical protein